MSNQQQALLDVVKVQELCTEWAAIIDTERDEDGGQHPIGYTADAMYDATRGISPFSLWGLRRYIERLNSVAILAGFHEPSGPRLGYSMEHFLTKEGRQAVKDDPYLFALFDANPRYMYTRAG